MCVIRIVIVSNYSSSLLSFIMIFVLLTMSFSFATPSLIILCLLHCFYCTQKNILCYILHVVPLLCANINFRATYHVPCTICEYSMPCHNYVRTYSVPLTMLITTILAFNSIGEVETCRIDRSVCMYRKFSQSSFYISTWCLGIPQGDTKPITDTW